MNDEKKLKRDVRTIWDSLKHERRERSKMTGAAELRDSAQRIASYATDLKQLAERAEALEAAPAEHSAEVGAKAKRKVKSNPKSE